MPKITMKLFWFLLPSLWAVETAQMATNSPDWNLCDEDEPTMHQYNNLTGQIEEVEDLEADDNKVSCLLYLNKLLRCTMAGRFLPGGSQLSSGVMIRDEQKTRTLPECSSEVLRPAEGWGEAKAVVECRVDPVFSYLRVLVNVSVPDTYTLHCVKYSFQLLEVLSPPPNISAVVSEGLLLVRWGIPYSRTSTTASCFRYELEVNKQTYSIDGRNNQTLPEDPAIGNTVRMRTMKSPNCLGPAEWSAWSQPIDLSPTGLHPGLNYVVVGSILLGTPMILLALLLLLRRPRVSKLLFPQIPQPSKKYKYFLKSPTSFLFLPVVQAAHEEDITVVDDM